PVDACPAPVCATPPPPCAVGCSAPINAFTASTHCCSSGMTTFGSAFASAFAAELPPPPLLDASGCTACVDAAAYGEDAHDRLVQLISADPPKRRSDTQVRRSASGPRLHRTTGFEDRPPPIGGGRAFPWW